MSYTDAIFYIDFENGDDATRPMINAVVFSNPASTTVRGNKVAHGLLDGAVITISGTTNGDGDWKISLVDADNFDLVGAVWASWSGADNTGDVVPFGGSSWADAWKRNKVVHANAVRDGCEFRYAQSPVPASVGNALWTGGLAQASQAITSSTNTTPIVVTKAAHGLVNGDFVLVYDHATNTAANGLWRVANKTNDTFELEGSVGNGIGGATGSFRKFTANVVYLDTAQTKTIENCNSPASWNGVTGLVVKTWEPLNLTNQLITNQQGTGYSVNDVVTIDDGDTNATIKVLTIGGGGEVLAWEQVTYGSGYSIANNVATTYGGGGTGFTVDILYVADVDVGSGGPLVKQGTDSLKVTRPSGDAYFYAGTSGLLEKLAYITIPSTDFSAYQEISFWLRPWTPIAFAAGIAEDEWRIELCSDTAGEAVVDTFKVPAQLYVNDPTDTTLPPAPRRVVIPRDGGGNMGAAIQSIRIATGAVAPASVQPTELVFDNIIACTTNGLTHQSLISKNSAAQGGAEPWHAIMSIDGRVVVLDGAGYDALANDLPPYYGTTENVATYKRETIKRNQNREASVVPCRFATSIIHPEASPVKFRGGWNTGTGLRTGETILDGEVYLDTGLDCSGVSNAQVEGFGVVNYAIGLETSYGVTSRRATFDLLMVSHCYNNGTQSGGAVQLSDIVDSEFTFGNIRNNRGQGLRFRTGAYRNLVDGATIVGNDAGISFDGETGFNRIQGLELYANIGSGIDLFGGLKNEIVSPLSADNGYLGPTGVIIPFFGSLILRDMLEADVADFANLFVDAPYMTDVRVHSHNHNQVAGAHYQWHPYSRARNLATTRTGGVGSMWELWLTGAYALVHNWSNPASLPIPAFAVRANALVTVKAWMRKGHATNVKGSLRLRGRQIAGVDNDVVVSLANDTDWQELTLTFTPTEGGEVGLELLNEYVAAAASVFIDDIRVSQGA